MTEQAVEGLAANSGAEYAIGKSENERAMGLCLLVSLTKAECLGRSQQQHPDWQVANDAYLPISNSQTQIRGKTLSSLLLYHAPLITMKASSAKTARQRGGNDGHSTFCTRRGSSNSALFLEALNA